MPRVSLLALPAACIAALAYMPGLIRVRMRICIRNIICISICICTHIITYACMRARLPVVWSLPVSVKECARPCCVCQGVRPAAVLVYMTGARRVHATLSGV